MGPDSGLRLLLLALALVAAALQLLAVSSTAQWMPTAGQLFEDNWRPSSRNNSTYDITPNVREKLLVILENNAELVAQILDELGGLKSTKTGRQFAGLYMQPSDLHPEYIFLDVLNRYLFDWYVSSKKTSEPWVKDDAVGCETQVEAPEPSTRWLCCPTCCPICPCQPRKPEICPGDPTLNVTKSTPAPVERVHKYASLSESFDSSRAATQAKGPDYWLERAISLYENIRWPYQKYLSLKIALDEQSKDEHKNYSLARMGILESLGERTHNQQAAYHDRDFICTLFGRLARLAERHYRAPDQERMCTPRVTCRLTSTSKKSHRPRKGCPAPSSPCTGCLPCDKWPCFPKPGQVALPSNGNTGRSSDDKLPAEELDWLPFESRSGLESVPHVQELDLSDRYDPYNQTVKLNVNDDDDTTSSSPRQSSNYLDRFKDTCGKAQLNGLSNGKGSGFVVNGQDQEYGEWPSYVQLTLGVGTRYQGGCGGTLISDRHVLTASHCVYGPDQRRPLRASSIQVTFGQHRTRARDQHEYSVRVKRMCRPSNFIMSNEELIFDWAVLELERAVQIDPHTSPACLSRTPPTTWGKMSKCWLVGVGATGFEKRGYGDMKATYPDVVQKMRVEQVKCRGWPIRNSDRSRSCYTKAFGQPGDSCRGDSGGPVLCLDGNKRWSLVGLVSYGTLYCNDDEGPRAWVGVYSNVNGLYPDIVGRCFDGRQNNFHT